MCKSLIDSKPLRISFDKIDRFIRVYNKTRHLVLFGGEKHDYIYNRIRYLISVKSSITDIISHQFSETKVDSYNSWPVEKTLTFRNVIILIESVWKKDTIILLL